LHADAGVLEAGQVDHALDAVLLDDGLERGPVEDGRVDERDAVGDEAFEAARQVVHDDRCQVVLLQRAYDVRTDVARTTGHQPAHRLSSAFGTAHDTGRSIDEMLARLLTPGVVALVLLLPAATDAVTTDATGGSTRQAARAAAPAPVPVPAPV